MYAEAMRAGKHSELWQRSSGINLTNSQTRKFLQPTGSQLSGNKLYKSQLKLRKSFFNIQFKKKLLSFLKSLSKL